MRNIIFPVNSKMKRLTLHCPIHNEVLYAIAMHNKELICLDLLNARNPFPRDYLRMLFLHLIKLRELSIHCSKSIDANPKLNSHINISRLIHLRRATFINIENCEELCFYYIPESVKKCMEYYKITLNNKCKDYVQIYRKKNERYKKLKFNECKQYQRRISYQKRAK